MGDNSWWFNRAGTIAPVSNPGSSVPNYGVTSDLTSAPYDSPDQFDALASALQAQASQATMYGPVLPGFSSVAQTYTPDQDLIDQAQADNARWQMQRDEAKKADEHKSIWDRAKGVAGWTGGQLAGVAGEITNATQYATSLGQDDINWGWGDTKAHQIEGTKHLLGNIAEVPGVDKLFWATEKANDFVSTAFLASSTAGDHGFFDFKGPWNDAKALQDKYHLNAGQAFMSALEDPEVVKDADRFDKIRQHNTLFNTGALAFNVFAAWKFDPNVIGLKGVGAARDLSVGKLGTGARTMQVQRDVLGQATREDAVTAAKKYAGLNLADNLRARHAVSLFDRAQQMRVTAQAVNSGEISFESFMNAAPFKTATAGPTLAKLMVDQSHNDENWNLIFRSAIGDQAAVGELLTKQADVADKINAIELGPLPKLEADLADMETRYQKRLAEQGKPQDAAIEITGFGDAWLHGEMTSLRAQADATKSRLAAYEDHESWLNRALPGITDPSAPDLDVMRNAVNGTFNSLDRLGGEGVIRRSLTANGGKVAAWGLDDYAPTSWIFRAPSKPLLKRVGVVSLNDVAEGGAALGAYLDQLGHITGDLTQAARDNVFSRWAGAATDLERQAAVKDLETEAIRAVGAKHGLSDELMQKLADHITSQRGKSWGSLSDTTMYSPIRGSEGKLLEMPDGAKVKLPIDPTQLPNWHPLTNLTDIDRLIRLHADELRSMDKELASRKKAGWAWTARHATEVADSFGTWFNSMWKPMALLSIRWPARVVADESMRVILSAGAMVHLANLREGVGNALYNNGIVRPYEWWNGRKVATGSVMQDSLRPGEVGYDPFDYRQVVNPQAAIPADEVDLGKLDPKRYDALNAAVAKRDSYLRKLEMHRANVRAAKGETPEMQDAVAAFTEPARPAWARKWDERLNEASTSETRGFFMDPVTHRPNSTGFAVSTYPGRLKTFARKPSARELNYWTQKNADVLSIPNNRIAVWLDKDTGRWHLDVVKTARRREDAMLIASRTKATEFFDINDGFTRYMSEDFYNHFDSPFTRPPLADAPLGVSADMAMVDDVASQGGAEIGAALGEGVRPRKKKIGFGTETWRTADGKTVTGQKVFGPDAENPNLYYGTTSSRGAFENMFAGYTKGLGHERRGRLGHDYRTFDPDNGTGTVEEWSKAYAHFVNHHVRYSPIWTRMAEGKSDDEIFNWLTTTAEGRSVRKRMGVRGENPHRWVDQEREIFDHLFPTERALTAARNGELDPKLVPDLIPEGMRPTVHGDTIKLALGQHAHQKLLGSIVGKAMDVLGTMPTDAMVRHPFANTIYRREMNNYLASVPADEITNSVLAAAEAAARAKALKAVRKVLYNIADEREGEHLLRFISPFFQAQVEVMQKYGQLIMDKPETLARLAQLMVGSQVVPSPLWQVVDQNGKPAHGYSADNKVIFQVTDTMRGLAHHIPGMGKALDYADSIAVPVSSLNLITSGDMPFLPSAGPIVTYPASEFYFKDKPELEKSAVYRWLYPYGVPKGSNFADRAMNTILPAYARRGFVAGTTNLDDSAFANLVSTIGAQQLYQWQKNGKQGPRPTPQMALDAAKDAYRLRMASSFFLPAPLEPRSPYQHWIDMYRDYQKRYGDTADEKFYDTVGPDFFMFAQQATQGSGMSPDISSKKAYDKYKSLADRAPDMISVLTGPYATGEFSDAVYQWQLDQPVSPTSDTKLRERMTPEQRLNESEISRGWVEYSKLSSVVDAELRNRVAAGGSPYLTAGSNADLKAYRDQQLLVLYGRNPAWQDAYNSRSKSTAEWLTHAYDVAFDKTLDDRPDIQGLRAYLIGRARLQDTLVQRQAAGISSSRQFSFDPMGNPIGDNADLYAGWMSWINEEKAKNPMFAEIYNRYLETDDLSTYIPPDVTDELGG